MRDLDDAGARPRSASTGRWPSTPRSCAVIRDHFAADGPRPDRRRAGDARPDVERALRAQDVPRRASSPTTATSVPPLLDQLRDATDAHRRAVRARRRSSATPASCRSPTGTTLALKAETHNHPSAVEPFGGANTGVGGVIRDVLGAAHRPIASPTCCASARPTCRSPTLPDGALHPRRIREGVDRRRRRLRQQDRPADRRRRRALRPRLTPPTRSCSAAASASPPTGRCPTGPFPATASSCSAGAPAATASAGRRSRAPTMDATTGEVAGASVQIGDPVTEKLLIDVLAGAERPVHGDHRLRRRRAVVGGRRDGRAASAPTSSSTCVPLKYPGLAPWEIWLSRGPGADGRRRRRPTASPSCSARCDRHGVELADLGAFTGDGRLVVRHARRRRARPRHRVPARRPAAAPDDRRRCRAPTARPAGATVDDPAATLLALLAHRNIASKAATIHRYDHEIGGGTVVRPLVGVGGRRARPTASCSPTRATRTASPIGIGVNPWYGLHDPEAMAYAVVDEAIRNVVAVGADPDRVALLDNFSWGDPRRPTTLGELVAAVDGLPRRRHRLRRAVRVRQGLAEQRVHRRRRPAPRRAADARDHRRRPRPRRRRVRHARARPRPATSLLLLGAHARRVRRQPPRPRARRAGRRRRRARSPIPTRPARYRRLHAAIRAGLVPACHDVSEGGLAVALAEMCIAGRLGVDGRRAAARRPRPPRCSPSRPAASSSRSRPATSTGFVELLGRRRPPCSASSPRRAACSRSPASTRLDVDDARRPRSPRAVTREPAAGARRRRARDRTATATPRSRSTSPAPSRRSCSPTSSSTRPGAARRRPHRRRRRRVQLRRRPRRRTDAGPRPHRRRRRPARRAPARRSSPAAGRSSASATASRCSPAPACCPARSATTPAAASTAAGSSSPPEPASRCIWTDRPRRRRRTARSPTARAATCTPTPTALAAAGQVALRYAGGNPNGSVADIAGVCDETGVVLGLMPHPENHVVARQHPRHRRDAGDRAHLGLRLFEAAVAPCQSDVMRRPLEPFVDIDLPLPDRRDGKVRVSYALAATSAACSSPPTACRRSTGSSPACRTRARCSTSWPRGGSTAPPTSSPTTSSPCPTPTCSSPAPPRRCRSRSSCAATSPASRRRRCGSSTPTGPARSTATTSPTGWRKNTALPEPIVTPTTKPPSRVDVHDEPLTCAEVVERGLVDADAVGAGDGGRARAVPPAASEVAAEAGLILADTKYEFGLDRRRRAAADRRGAHARLVAVLGRRHVRRAAGRRRGAGEPRQGGRAAGASPTPATAATASRPTLPDDVWTATSARYIDAYERLTGAPFEPGATRSPTRIVANLDDMRGIL